MTEPWQPYPAQPPYGQQSAGPPPVGPGWPPQPPTVPGWPGYPSGPGYPGGPATPVRRSKVPYVIGAVLIVVGIIGAIVAAAGGYAAALDSTDAKPFGVDTDTAVHLQAGQSKVIYVAASADNTKVHCDITGDTGQAHITSFDGGLSVNQWQALFTIAAESTGDYTVTCSAHDDPSFTIGTDASTPIALGVGVGVFSGFVAFAGVIVLLVTFIRRRRTPVSARPPSPPYPYR
jgi:hypothetical protein